VTLVTSPYWEGQYIFPTSPFVGLVPNPSLPPSRSIGLVNLSPFTIRINFALTRPSPPFVRLFFFFFRAVPPLVCFPLFFPSVPFIPSSGRGASVLPQRFSFFLVPLRVEMLPSSVFFFFGHYSEFPPLGFFPPLGSNVPHSPLPRWVRKTLSPPSHLFRVFFFSGLATRAPLFFVLHSP